MIAALTNQLCARPVRCGPCMQIWDFYLFWGDPALHHFVVLAFVIGNADVILQVSYRWRSSLLLSPILAFSICVPSADDLVSQR